MGSAIAPNPWTDEQLSVIFDETGDWTVNGRQGKVLGRAASLRLALDRAADYALCGVVVIALCRLPSDDIVVFPPQIARLREIIAASDEGERKLAAELMRPFNDLTHRVH
jgi:hypothetical protein